jgi:hypothetical protein
MSWVFCKGYVRARATDDLDAGLGTVGLANSGPQQSVVS